MVIVIAANATPIAFFGLEIGWRSSKVIPGSKFAVARGKLKLPRAS